MKLFNYVLLEQDVQGYLSKYLSVFRCLENTGKNIKGPQIRAALRAIRDMHKWDTDKHAGDSEIEGVKWAHTGIKM